jgi:hypothetical protein
MTTALENALSYAGKEKEFTDLDAANKYIARLIARGKELADQIETMDLYKDEIRDIQKMFKGTQYQDVPPVEAVQSLIDDMKDREAQREIDEIVAAVQQMCITHKV